MKTFLAWIIAQVETLLVITLLFSCYLATLEGENDILTKFISTDGMNYFKTFFIIIIILALLLVIRIGVFTWKNFKEVISRSLVWHTSNVARLNMKMKYVFVTSLQLLFIFIVLPCWLFVWIFV